MHDDQYSVLCTRRQAFDNMVWQVPSLAIAAQSFLLSTAFDSKTEAFNSLLLSTFALVIGLAALQLMHKHRQLEIEDAELLKAFEEDHLEEGYVVIHGKRDGVPGIERGWLVKLSSFRIWSIVLLCLVLFDAYATFKSIDHIVEGSAVETSCVASQAK